MIALLRNAVVAAPAVALALISLPSPAADFTCTITGEVRHLQLDIPGDNHLCEVNVTPENGERRAVWYADNSTQFCSDKLVELVGKYENEWGFSCAAWPGDDQLAELDANERQRIDAILIERRSRPDGGPTSMRTIAGPTQANGQRLVAVQWFGQQASDDALSLFLDGVDRSAWSTLAYVENLPSIIRIDDGSVQRAFIDRIDGNGIVTLNTVIAPPEGATAEQRCRGEQLFSISAEGELDALTPHRYSCHTETASLPTR